MEAIDTICLIVTVALFAIAAAVMSKVLIELDHLDNMTISEALQLPIPDDKPLLTKQEKEWAKESGIGSYYFNGEYYIDENLPSTYWEE